MIIVTIIFIILSLGLATVLYLQFIKKQDSDNVKIVSLEQINTFKEIVDSYIDRYFHETLFYYLNKEIKFDDNSSISMQKKFNYRECIRNLIRPDVKLDGFTFKQVFTQRIYLYFLSETPKNIKDLIYAFHSGYDINNYWIDEKLEKLKSKELAKKKKKDKKLKKISDNDDTDIEKKENENLKKREKSVSVYVINHIDKMINQYFYEVTRSEEIIFNEIGDSGNTAGMDTKLNLIDSNFYSKLCSFIYNLNVIRGIEIFDEKQQEIQSKPEGEKQK